MPQFNDCFTQKNSILMKALIAICALGVGVVPPSTSAQFYNEGDTLRVVANSGLRLRTAPHTDAGTIRVLHFGEPVHVVNTFGFGSDHRGSAGWFAGHWIRVRSGHVEGFVFDAFLTRLAIPNHEDELVMDDLVFVLPLRRFLDNHYMYCHEEYGMDHSEDIAQRIHYYDEGIIVKETSGWGWHQMEVRFSDYRLSEVVNLLRSMLPDRRHQDMFEDSLRFYKDRRGELYRVTAGFGSTPPIKIERHAGGEVSLTLTETPEGMPYTGR